MSAYQWLKGAISLLARRLGCLAWWSWQVNSRGDAGLTLAQSNAMGRRTGPVVSLRDKRNFRRHHPRK